MGVERNCISCVWEMSIPEHPVWSPSKMSILNQSNILSPTKGNTHLVSMHLQCLQNRIVCKAAV